MNKTKHPQNRCNALNTTPTLLLELGGQSALDALVGAFYFNVLTDERLAHFFANSDTEAIRNHQRKFFAVLLGGQDLYRGRSLNEAHRVLVQEHGLNHDHFDAIAEVLAATLHQFGHSTKLNQKIISRVHALRADVLNTCS